MDNATIQYNTVCLNRIALLKSIGFVPSTETDTLVRVTDYNTVEKTTAPFDNGAEYDEYGREQFFYDYPWTDKQYQF